MSDLGELRRQLARQYGADACCHVTVQKHLVKISVEENGPFWRVINPDRPFALRTAGGPECIRQKLAEERADEIELTHRDDLAKTKIRH